MVDVSVVVPVYNSEQHLKECVESLIQQTLRNVEFIFVDDGSTDHSAKILEEYQKKDGRIRLIRQKNLHAGVARNNGMREATGKYIIFLDSDDFFKPDMLEKAFHCAEQNQAEITVFGYSRFNDLDHTVEKMGHPDFPTGVFSLRNVGDCFFDLYIAAPWNKLFLHSFILENGLCFQTLRRCNDAFFTHMSAYLAKRIVYLRKSLVYYRVNNRESLQGNVNRDRSIFVEFEKAIKSALSERDLFEGVYRSAYYRHLINTVHLYGSLNQAEIDSYREYYNRVKEELVPGLFDSESDFDNDPFIRQIYTGTFEDVLFYQAMNMAKQFEAQIEYSHMVENSRDYQVGHAVLLFPRTVWKQKKNFRNRKRNKS
jgi:Glycosyltransferases involved in cell wall biogenesis